MSIFKLSFTKGMLLYLLKWLYTHHSPWHHISMNCIIWFTCIIYYTKKIYIYYTSIEKGNRNGEQQNTFLYFVTLYQQESCGIHMYENTHIFLFLKKVFFTILRFVSHEYKTHILQFHALCNIFFKFVWGQDNNKYKRYIYTFKNIIHIFVP